MIFLLVFDKYSCKKLSVKSADATLIASTLSEFKNFAIELFKDEKLWINLRNNLISKRGTYNWSIVAKQLTNQINV